jgi:hypothetical protein
MTFNPIYGVWTKGAQRVVGYYTIPDDDGNAWNVWPTGQNGVFRLSKHPDFYGDSWLFAEMTRREADGFSPDSEVARPPAELAAAKADAWDEGARWAAVEAGVITSPVGWLSPGDNPYRTAETSPATDDGLGLDTTTTRPGCHCFMWDEDCPDHPNNEAGEIR